MRLSIGANVCHSGCAKLVDRCATADDRLLAYVHVQPVRDLLGAAAGSQASVARLCRAADSIEGSRASGAGCRLPSEKISFRRSR